LEEKPVTDAAARLDDEEVELRVGAQSMELCRSLSAAEHHCCRPTARTLRDREREGAPRW
jgi:hypothetical protein